MRVLRGRAGDIAADRAATRDLFEWVAETGQPAVRAWTPHRHVAFGRRDTRVDGYEAARAAAESRGYPAVERDSGGRAVAHTGATVAFVRAEPIGDMRQGLGERYDRAVADLRVALSRVGVRANPGEPAGAFCPGTHSLQKQGKIVGIAQRVRSDAALVGGIVVIRDREEVARVLEPIYEALDVPFDPHAVGSVADAGGESDPETVARAVETALVGDHTARIERVRGT